MQKGTKWYKLCLSYLVLLSIFFLVYLGYTETIMYVYDLEKNSYTLRLCIAFSLIMPIRAVMSLIKFSKVRL